MSRAGASLSTTTFRSAGMLIPDCITKLHDDATKLHLLLLNATSPAILSEEPPGLLSPGRNLFPWRPWLNEARAAVTHLNVSTLNEPSHSLQGPCDGDVDWLFPGAPALQIPPSPEGDSLVKAPRTKFFPFFYHSRQAGLALSKCPGGETPARCSQPTLYPPGEQNATPYRGVTFDEGPRQGPVLL